MSQEAVAAAEASRLAMARLMAVAGHDLKQPLQVALLSLDGMAGEVLSHSGSKRLRIALDAMQRLGAELNDIARLSQQGDVPAPAPSPVALGGIFARLERDWRFYAEARGVRLRVARPPHHVSSDPAMLHSILRNLVGNAVDYTDRGGTVDIRCETRGSQAVVEIEDNGRGIAAEHLGRIFDAFERGAETGRPTGLGLGLLIVRQTAELLRHPVSVSSQRDVGSIFRVELPLAVPSAGPARETAR